MKNKNRKKLKRITALLLTIMLLLTFTDYSPLQVIFAATVPSGDPGTSKKPVAENPTDKGDMQAGTGGYGGGVTSGPVDVYGDTTGLHWRMGYLLRLAEVENAVPYNKYYSALVGTKGTLATSSSGTYTINECHISAAAANLETYPSYFQNNSNVINETALIIRTDGAEISTWDPDSDAKKVHYAYAAGVTSGTFVHYFHVDATSVTNDWEPYKVVYDKVATDNTLLNKFINGELTYEELGTVTPSPEAINNVLHLFGDTGDIRTAMAGAWTIGEDTDYKLKLLDFLLTINYMCGGQHTELIRKYLTTLNGNGSNSFIIPVAASVAIYNSVPGHKIKCSTLPDYYGYINGGTSVRMPIGVNNDGTEVALSATAVNVEIGTGVHVTDSLNGWFQYFENYAGKRGSGSIGDYTRRIMWWDPSKASGSFKGSNLAFTLVPMDLYGKPSGTIGFTHLALGGSNTVIPPTAPPDNEKPPTEELPKTYDFIITAETDTPILAEDTTATSANLIFDIATEKALAIKSLMLQNTQAGGKAHFSIEVVREINSGNITDTTSSCVDSFLSPGSMTLNGGKTSPKGSTEGVDTGIFGSNTVKYGIDDVTWETLEPYLKGKEKLLAVDSGLNISSKKVKATYYAVITLVFDGLPAITTEMGTGLDINDVSCVDGKRTIRFYGRGVKSYPAYMYQASDDVTWGTDPDIPHYYSVIGKADIPDNYVEIKHNVPNGEKFEAMAGVPTTEKLYVGFGITEFMVNMDAHADGKGYSRTQSNVERTYTYTYKNNECYGNNTSCVVYCAGHKFEKPGCNKVTCTSTTANKDTNGDGVFDIHEHNDSCAKCDSGESITIECNGTSTTQITGTLKCECGSSSMNYTVTPKSYVSGHKIESGKDTCGCRIKCYVNEKHRGITITAKIKQPIEEFSYFDITAADVWRISNLKANLNSSVFTTDSVNTNIPTASYAFVDQEDYKSSGNGRLLFKTSDYDYASGDTNNSNIWGDSFATKTVSDNQSLDEMEESMSNWINGICNGKTVRCLVISDYIILGTTQGYQYVSFYTQQSENDAKILNTECSVEAKFEDSAIADNPTGAGGEANILVDANDITGKSDTITFSETPSLAKQWTDNKLSAAKWSQYDVTRTGYNGKYNQPKAKWDNNNRTEILYATCALASDTEGFTAPRKFQPRAHGSGLGITQPNTNYNNVSSFNKTNLGDGFGNVSTTIKGLTINNYVKPDTKEYPKLQQKRVANGEHDTGNCYIKAVHVLDHNDTQGGINYSSYENNVEVGYTSGKSSVNDIVIHNPVSVQNAEVISNDSDLDLRSKDGLTTGGDPVSAIEVCPNDMSCQYQTLSCNKPITKHTAECISSVSYKTCTSKLHVEDGFKLDVQCTSHGLTEHPQNAKLYCYAASAGVSPDKITTHNTECYESYYVAKCVDNRNIYIHNESFFNLPCAVESHNHTKPTKVLDCIASIKGFTPEFHNAGCYTRVTDKHGTRCYLKCNNAKHILYDPMWFNNSADEVFYCHVEDHNHGIGAVTLLQCYSSRGIAIAMPSYHCMEQVSKLVCTDNTHVGSVDELNALKTTACTDKDCPHMNVHYTNRECYAASISTPTKTVDPSKITYHSESCFKTTSAFNCNDPHHVDEETFKYIKDAKVDTKHNALYHYAYGNSECWKPCGKDANHKKGATVTVITDKPEKNAGTFINLDREFWIHVPDTGDFAQSPSLHGILNTTNVRGMGYTNGMNCFKWTREKFVIFPFDVISDGGYTYPANSKINLYHLRSYADTGNTSDTTYYRFYCTASNKELANADVKFVTIATNAEMKAGYINESVDVTNKNRVDDVYAARHTAEKIQKVDLIGSIGSLTIEDTGDFRFANLFKKEQQPKKWLVTNLMPAVNYEQPNKVVTDLLDVRHNDVRTTGVYHNTYGTNAFKENIKQLSRDNTVDSYLALPLVPRYNLVESLRNQPMRPGYKLYMDVSTLGNYYGITYGENDSGAGRFVDDDMVYKMQIMPRYYLLTIKTNGTYEYIELDAYMGKHGNYSKINSFKEQLSTNDSEYYLFMNWRDEKARRNYLYKGAGVSSTFFEDNVTKRAVDFLSTVLGYKGNESGYPTSIRIPTDSEDVIGTADVLYLNDRNRTFIGSSKTYKTKTNADGSYVKIWDDIVKGPKDTSKVPWYDKNPHNILQEDAYAAQVQRWHFTIGLPSSVVFVPAGQKCTTANIDEIKKAENSVIVCALDIKVKGTVWTLEYDGSAINNRGIKITEGGPTVPSPSEEDPNDPNRPAITDPIVAVMSNKYTSADDLRTQGTH